MITKEDLKTIKEIIETTSLEVDYKKLYTKVTLLLKSIELRDNLNVELEEINTELRNLESENKDNE